MVHSTRCGRCSRRLYRLPWGVLESALYAELAAQRVVHSRADGGMWLTPDHAVYADGAVQRCLPCPTCFHGSIYFLHLTNCG